MQEILSHEEIKRLLERNNLNPEIGRPVYVPWSDNKGKCFTQWQLDAYLSRNNVGEVPTSQRTWEKQLNSGPKRIQLPGKKDAYEVKRPVKTKNGWTEIPLNARS